MKWIQGEVVSQREWAPGLYSLYVRADIQAFVAGQFTQVALDPSQKLFRPYSFTNAPDEPLLEFYYTLVNDGEFTNQLTQLTSGDPIWIASKASGKLTLSHVNDAKSIWFMATGTGLGPFISILKTLESWRRFDAVVLIHSVRYGQELTHQDVITSWRSLYQGQFHYCPIVTRELLPEAYNERLTTLLTTQKIEQDLQIPLSEKAQVMLCGNPQMIKEVNNLLIAKGMAINTPHKSGQITFENYWKP